MVRHVGFVRLPRVRRWTFGSLCLVLVMLVTACGGSSSKNSTPTATVRPPTATVVPTATQTTAQQFPYSSVWHFKNQAGYSYDMTIALGTPMRMPSNGSLAHPLDRDFLLESACSANPKLDVVIPAYWSAEATTVGFDTTIAMRALFSGGGQGLPDREYRGHGVTPYDGDNRVLVAQNFSDGPVCSVFSSTNNFGYAASSGFSVQWSAPVSTGTVRRDSFFIIVKDYYSPAAPNGDTALLDWIMLRPLLGGDTSDGSTVYTDTDGAYLGVYSDRGIALSGRVIDPNAPTPTMAPTSTRTPFPTRTPSPTQTPSPTTAPTPTKQVNPAMKDASTGSIVVTNKGGIVMWDGAGGEASGSVAVLSRGTRLTVLSGPVDSDGYDWWEVQDDEGHKGWVKAIYLEPS